MLVVTANWGITDGTLVRPAAGWQPRLITAVRRAVGRAGFRQDGSYRPVDLVDLVVAGDAFDWLVSAEWCGRHRPWHGGAATEEIVRRIALRSIRSGRRLLGQLARWGRRGLEVPAPDHRGRPALTTARVAVRVTVLAGDRDERLSGMARPARLPIAVGEAWDHDHVTIRHGHDRDPACHRPESVTCRRPAERPPTLAESVAVDLVAPFAVAVHDAIGPVATRLVRSLAAARAVEIPAVLTAWRRGLHGADIADAGPRLDAVWRRCVDRWAMQARRSVPSCEAEFDAVDALAGWLAFAAAGEGPGGGPPGLERLAVRCPPTPRTVATHAWRPADGQGPPVVAVSPDAEGIRLTALVGREPREPVITVGATGCGRVDGNAIVDAA
ncbi:MAG: hypothetical protein ACKOC8_11255 [Pirellulales bacterium]